MDSVTSTTITLGFSAKIPPWFQLCRLGTSLAVWIPMTMTQTSPGIVQPVGTVVAGSSCGWLGRRSNLITPRGRSEVLPRSSFSFQAVCGGKETSRKVVE